MYFFPMWVLFFAHSGAAQLQPHRAEYVLRLGKAVNAPRVGTATEDLTLDCEEWHLQRNVKGEVPISATWKFDLASMLVSDETHSGDDLRYRSLQVQNGAEREVRGTVQRVGGELRARNMSPDGSANSVLPTLTQMPVASIGYVIERLRAGLASFSMLSFDAQGSGEVFRVDVAQIENSALRRRLPSIEPVGVPGRSWPIQMSFTRGTGAKPLFTLSSRLFESGILDYVTVDAEMVVVSADLMALKMYPSPGCQSLE
jgi:EipB-like